MKVIFLDVDGVLDVFDPGQYMQELKKDAVIRLKKIVDDTDAKIVVISNWRYGSPRYIDQCRAGHTFQQECDNWPTLIKVLNQYGMQIYDVTPWQDTLSRRGDEIMEYRRKHPEISSFVILDDCFFDDYSEFTELRQRLVFVDASQALQEHDVEKAIALLQEGK